MSIDKKIRLVSKDLSTVYGYDLQTAISLLKKAIQGSKEQNNQLCEKRLEA